MTVAPRIALPSRAVPSPVEHAAMLEETHESLAAAASASVKAALAEHEYREV